MPYRDIPKLTDNETSVQVGILLGAEWRIGDIALHLGVTSQAISLRKSRDKTGTIEKIRGWTKVAISKYVEERIKAAEEDFNERKTRIHKKGYKVIEKSLNKALSEETDSPDITHLKAAEMGIERTEGKAMDRKAILSMHADVGKREVDGADLENVLRETALLNELRRKALPPVPANVDEAELVK